MQFHVHRTSDIDIDSRECAGAHHEILDLEALLEFVRVNGRCIVALPYEGCTALYLEIYDDYRE